MIVLGQSSGIRVARHSQGLAQAAVPPSQRVTVWGAVCTCQGTVRFPECHGPALLQACPRGHGASVRALLDEQ